MPALNKPALAEQASRSDAQRAQQHPTCPRQSKHTSVVYRIFVNPAGSGLAPRATPASYQTQGAPPQPLLLPRRSTSLALTYAAAVKAVHRAAAQPAASHHTTSMASKRRHSIMPLPHRCEPMEQRTAARSVQASQTAHFRARSGARRQGGALPAQRCVPPAVPRPRPAARARRQSSAPPPHQSVPPAMPNARPKP